MTDFADLHKKAEAATSGPWEVHETIISGKKSIWIGSAYPGWIYRVLSLNSTRGNPTQRDANAAFIAAANPQAILSLLDAIAVKTKRTEMLERMDAEAAIHVASVWAIYQDATTNNHLVRGQHDIEPSAFHRATKAMERTP